MLKYAAITGRYSPFSLKENDIYTIQKVTVVSETPKTIRVKERVFRKTNRDYKIFNSEKEAFDYLIFSLVEKRKNIVRTIRAKEAEHFEIEQKLMDLKEDK